MNALASRILERLAATNQNPSEVSLAAGLNRSAIRDIIANEANPRIDTIKKLVGPLQCSLEYLTGTENLASTGTPPQTQDVDVAASTVLAVAASQWQSVPTPDQIIRALAAGGFAIVPAGVRSGDLSETLRTLSDGESILELGPRIAAIRKDQGLTQEEFSEKLGCHGVTVSKLENNKIDVTVEWLLRIADALDVDASQLLSPPLDGDAIRAAREALGWSQEHLAQTADTNQQTVDRIERGATRHSRALPAILRSLKNGDAQDITDSPLAYIHDVMKRHNVTSTELARKAGIAASTINKPLRDKGSKNLFNTRTLQKIRAWDRAASDSASEALS
ncbi:helix-turn-helix domain-containing protein [Tardiphaga sp.]|uniref:helix-turn-helix domain-containing protein n=1 Tax=Tardiphaga sp. TaxID=1926292 RepID=UPI0026043655|nr:helix-turn-helix domain-containing protein [Tardiphaga sp.]MDB5618536.1 hypothetical protein [Tardiphaga sp.]